LGAKLLPVTVTCVPIVPLVGPSVIEADLYIAVSVVACVIDIVRAAFVEPLSAQWSKMMLP
jgi:hypothetical protein